MPNRTLLGSTAVTLWLAALTVTGPFALSPSQGKATPPPPKEPVSVPRPTIVEIPGGSGGVRFDDLQYSSRLGKILLPAGKTGELDLVDPHTLAVTAISGFSTGSAGKHRWGEGTTSVDEGAGFLFASDRTSRTVKVIDPASRKIVASAPLASGPDYVRFVAPTREIWVSEPGAEQIEVFRLPEGPAPVPVHEAVISVPGGPESLVIDAQRGLAYTNLWKDQTLAIDLRKRTIVSRWPNGCEGSRGLALDAADGWLFVGCAEGGVSVLDLAHGGKVLDHLKAGEGVDIIAYDPALRHLYVPGALSATLSILGVSAAGKLSLLGTFPTEKGCHGVAAVGGKAFVPDPHGGRLLVMADPYPPAK